MKKIFKQLMSWFMRLWSHIYSYNFSQRLQGSRDMLYTLWIRNFLGEVGENVSMERGVSIYGGKFVTIGECTKIQRGTSIEAHFNYNNQIYTPRIEIGSGCNLGCDNHLTAIRLVKVGNNVLTGRRVTISDNNHGIFSKSSLENMPSKRTLSTKGAVIIGDNVWIGENVCVLSGVRIGNGCVIAANAVVTHDIPPYSMAGGVPAKVIKSIYEPR